MGDLSEWILVSSNNCRYCGVNTRFHPSELGGFVNRVPQGMDLLDCYSCGICEDTLQGILDDDSVDDFDFDNVYLPERIKEVDALCPTAILFRTIVQLVEGQGHGPFKVTFPEDIELCHGCGKEVMYEDSDNFDPVTYGKDDAIFHSDCWEPHHGCVNGCEDICKCEEYNQGED